MRVALVTTWHERCGLAAYSENIVKHLPQVDWRIIGREEWGDNFSNVPLIAQTCDITHVMHQGGLMGSMSAEVVRACGPRTIITRQCVGDEAVFEAAAIRTAHVEIPGYRFIPHGIPVVELVDIRPLIPPRIGCAGIPFDGKGHWEAVQIAEKLGWGLNLVMPENPHTSQALALYIRDQCRSKKIPLTLETRWLEEDQVVRILQRSAVNVFFYTRWANGISGAVRMGLAAGRPVVVSRHNQFQDIIPSGCVTVANSVDEVADLILNAVLPYPNNLAEAWGYDKTAAMYYGLYCELYH